MKNILLLFIIISPVLFFSCKKESFITSSDASLIISTDSIKFDTVFTTAGSITQSFKIFNNNNQKILLSKIKLMGGAGSAFQININGFQAAEADDVEIAAEDSIYVFVSIFVNPTSGNLPFIISDSILINYNGNDRYVQLEAYGQNAHFLRNEVISGNVSWPADLPYVILGGLQVDTTASLTMAAGCKIYSHANAPFIVDGTLLINGSKNNEVMFTGDRLDAQYKDLPAGWPGIYFRGPSKDNQMNYAIIKNSNQAIVVQDPSINANPKLILHQCIIDNAFEVGLFSINSSIEADNSLITNCGNNINIQLGGNYTFTHCTVAAYSSRFLLHTNPVLSAINYSTDEGPILTANMNAVFRNCIFWGDNGSVDDEVIIDKQGSNNFQVTLENCLYKAVNDPVNATLTSNISNADPVFDSIDITNNYFDFRITKDLSSAAIDNGVITSFPKDLDNNARIVGILPDIGCFEKP